MAARAVVLVLLMLAGCGFRPLYVDKDGAGPSVSKELASVDVQGLNGRLEQILRNQLTDFLNPAGVSVGKQYNLVVALEKKTTSLAIQLDRTATRENLTLKAKFELRRRSDGRVVFRSTVVRIAGYDVLREPFATLIAEQSAEKRASREVSFEITNLVALHFSRVDGEG